ncbi:Lysosomal acid lipase/cholesteryl ester hydrolase [Fragariocoptes setiger]|uniref:Lysosomal acid lipase/cholesteryl ester hydrolase n=1 Tax=Fragariocoptes setiger TaxID=1670756 RepID=A0ABQ7SAR2_9ACAR|nr:Lysosomal acid lipase/cholesteryl ester hydrolase [Fragariocoptes setiger]
MKLSWSNKFDWPCIIAASSISVTVYQHRHQLIPNRGCKLTSLRYKLDGNPIRNIKKRVSIFSLTTLVLALQFVQIGVHSTGNNAVDLAQVLAGYESLEPWHDIEPDAYLSPTEFIRSRGFDVEFHRIVTPDGYVLSMNRIVNPKIRKRDRDLLRPVLLQHGLLTSSMVFMTASDRHRDRPAAPTRPLRHRLRRLLPPLVRQDRGSWRFWADVALNTLTTRNGYRQLDDRTYVTDSLAFMLANQNYDVWMPNSRGTRYSLNHTHYDHRHDHRYWEYSFHEHALFDLPSCIEHVLTQTGHSSLAYVGHSQGNMMMFILQSLRPEYADKIRPFIAVAPIAFIPDLYFGLVRPLISTLADTKQLDSLLKGQVFNQGPLGQLMLDLLCRPRYTPPVCDFVLLLTLGDALKRANRTQTAMLVHHIPDSTSVHNLLHFAQLVSSGRFEAFDYGPQQNLLRYGTKFPTRYPIENIVSHDIALLWGARDPLATPKNVALTRSHLTVPLMDDYLAPDLAWGHSDFFYARGAGKLINLHILSLLDRYN